MGRKIMLLTFLTVGITGIGITHPQPFQQDKKTGDTSKALPQSYFEEDPRLDATTTIKSHNSKNRELWTTLGSKIRAPIEREEAAREIEDGEIALAGSKVTLRALMDALAAHVLASWERTEKNGYRILVNQFGRDFVYGSKSKWERERFVAGAEFIRDMDMLSKAEQSRLQSGEYVPFNSLPGRMQQAVAQMLDALSEEYEQNGKPPTLQTDVLPQAVFRLERKPARGFNRYFITVKVKEVGASGWRLNDYEAQKQARETARQAARGAGKPDSIYRPVKWELSQEEAKRLPALERVVSLDLPRVTFPEVLRRLHEKYDIAFVSDTMKNMPQLANVSLRSMPLGEALDRLTQIYNINSGGILTICHATFL